MWGVGRGCVSFLPICLLFDGFIRDTSFMSFPLGSKQYYRSMTFFFQWFFPMIKWPHLALPFCIDSLTIAEVITQFITQVKVDLSRTFCNQYHTRPYSLDLIRFQAWFDPQLLLEDMVKTWLNSTRVNSITELGLNAAVNKSKLKLRINCYCLNYTRPDYDPNQNKATKIDPNPILT